MLATCTSVGEQSMSEQRVAVLVDGDNISVSHASHIMTQAKTLGRVDIARVYAAATQSSGWATAAGYRIIHAGHGKNAADVLLCIEAMELALAYSLDRFVIASSDNDFTHLALRLRERGAIVAGLGEAKAPAAFRAACSAFKVLGTPPAAPAPVPPKPLVAKTDLDSRVCEIIAKGGNGVALKTLADQMRTHHGIVTKNLPSKNWRAYLTQQAGLYVLDAPSPAAMVRLRKAGP